MTFLIHPHAIIFIIHTYELVVVSSSLSYPSLSSKSCTSLEFRLPHPSHGIHERKIRRQRRHEDRRRLVRIYSDWWRLVRIVLDASSQRLLRRRYHWRHSHLGQARLSRHHRFHVRDWRHSHLGQARLSRHHRLHVRTIIGGLKRVTKAHTSRSRCRSRHHLLHVHLSTKVWGRKRVGVARYHTPRSRSRHDRLHKRERTIIGGRN
jgi:hypothetical protein